MPKLRFVQPETARLDLGDGEWVEAKKGLTYGEQERLNGMALVGKASKNNPDELEVGMDWERYKVERLFLWLTDWSARDAADKPVRLTRDALKSLDPDSVIQIDAVLDAHIEAQAELKKATPGKTRPEPK